MVSSPPPLGNDEATRSDGPDHSGGASGGDPQPPQSAIPARLGRYVVVEEVGRGGMGRVLRAYDAKLRREVALKLLTPGADDSSGAERIVREARAMARLSHPNLVSIYDVEHEGADVFIAMEYVEGDTLRRWLDRGPSRQEVIAAFCGAARGLAAAHAAGIVHRDFKPSNAIVARDGRVRVMDFGLARGLAAHDHDDPDAEGDPELVALSTELTAAGAMMGTPPFMAPEQHRGGAVSAATDQYALCVALYEALHRVWPFGGTDLAALARAKQRGVPARGPASPGVPPWLNAAILRGLAPDPQARWPSMDALVAALERGDALARRRRVIVTGVGIGVVVAAVVIGMRLDHRAQVAACQRQGAAIDELWNDARRATVREAVLNSRASHATTTAERLMPWLDAHAETWRAARTQTCMDTMVHRTWDTAVHDRSVWCLEDRRLEFDALVSELHHADVLAATRAVQAAIGLRQIEPCRDPAALERLPAPPADAHDAFLAVRTELARSRALQSTGAYPRGLDAARASLEQARQLGWPPLTSAALSRVATLLEYTGAYAEAATMQESAYFEAMTAGATEEALDAAHELIFVVGFRLARHEEGERWARHASVLRAMVPDPAGLREAASAGALAMVLGIAGDTERAAELHIRALDLYERALGPDHPRLATSLNNFGGLRHDVGAYDDAARLHARALAIRERTLGPDHPDVASSLDNLAVARAAIGDHGEATALHERALAIRERALGPEHPDVAATLSNLATLRYMAGAFDEAAALHERVLATLERALGPDHPNVAMSAVNLANAHYVRGRYDEAAALYERAIAAIERALGPDHPDLTMCLNNLAMLRATTGEHDAAATLYRRSLSLAERGLAADHPELARAVVGLGDVALAQGRHADALALAQRGVALRERTRLSPGDLAEARLLLARALVATGGDTERAVTLAEQARDGWRGAGDAYRDALANAEAWLSEHGRARTAQGAQPMR